MGRVLGKKQITPFLYELIFGSEMGRVYKKSKKKKHSGNFMAST